MHVRTKPKPCDCKSETANVSKWNESNKYNLINALSANLDMLNMSVDNSAAVDETIENFTAILNDIWSPFCTQTFNKRCCDFTNGTEAINTPCDKPWFTDECKALYHKYKYELRQIKRNKNQLNRLRLADAKKKKKKKAYKRVNIRLKRNFLRTEGNMLSMKTDNHKLFYKMFKRRKGASNCPLNVNDLKNFFQDLMKSGTYNQEIPGDRECKGILCAKMDNSIQAEEVKNAMKRLKKEKATGLDGILNEVYISCESLLVPVIVKIFNKILNSEKFPSS